VTGAWISGFVFLLLLLLLKGAEMRKLVVLFCLLSSLLVTGCNEEEIVATPLPIKHIKLKQSVYVDLSFVLDTQSFKQDEYSRYAMAYPFACVLDVELKDSKSPRKIVVHEENADAFYSELQHQLEMLHKEYNVRHTEVFRDPYPGESVLCRITEIIRQVDTDPDPMIRVVDFQPSEIINEHDLEGSW
jgi:hypothetical protein